MTETRDYGCFGPAVNELYDFLYKKYRIKDVEVLSNS
jgi:hypothetical protein